MIQGVRLRCGAVASCFLHTFLYCLCVVVSSWVDDNGDVWIMINVNHQLNPCKHSLAPKNPKP